ncbi:MAG: alpha/beta hydrolase [Rhodocyclales bacterium]|nr:alpha/beta hydrolase [Rhodocyclales bacterium]
MRSDWILLRGLTREARHWGEFPAGLAASLGVRVHCLDLPGNGRLNRTPSPFTVEGMADWCHRELRHVGLARPCGVLAMSLGAMVAVAWAGRHAGDIDRAVLINTSFRPFSLPWQRLRPANYPRLLRLLALPASARSIEQSVMDMTSRHPVDRGERLMQWQDWRRQNPVSRRNALAQLIAAAGFRAPSRSPLRRLLLLASAGDGLVDVDCSRTLASRWQVELREHPDAGHDLPLDDPAWVLHQVAQWLRADSGNEGGGLAAPFQPFQQH